MLRTKSVAASKLPSFKLSETDVSMGASLGNSAVWIHTKGTGAIERIFLNEIGQSLFGAIAVRYAAHARPVSRGLLDGHRDEATYSTVYPETGTRRFEMHPAYQRVAFQVASVLEVEETTFVPLAAYGSKDAAIVCVIVDVRNRDVVAHPIRVTCSAMLQGDTPADLTSAYDEAAHALIASNASHRDWVRVMAASVPAQYGVDVDAGAIYDPSDVHRLNNTIDAEGDSIGSLQVDLTVGAQKQEQLCFTFALSSAGTEAALRELRNAGAPAETLSSTIALLEEELRLSTVLTPDKTINEGALWSKVNMRRVMASYASGNAFTNDPGKYANVVVRDSAWFVFGNDHFLPQFSRDLLNWIVLRQYPNGKLPEYIDALDGRVEDYGLNINDNTPLFILAVNHHVRATGDITWLREMYPAVARAARYIISQIDDRGLVFCNANDERGGIWAIAGWRNIISDYKISGAVTELNAECVAALRSAGHLAENLGGMSDDSHAFTNASERLKAAMDKYLINPRNGMYYLNIDVDGNPRTDVTGDQIFPVIMRACDDETGFRIISRLNYEDFSTAAGLRTVSRYDPRYDPSACSGLSGGVWPGLTWWYAFGAARYHPEVMVRALRSSFEHYGADPKRNNTVPGQFSEWFEGESLENRGMRLSPWEPPRFLWAAIEGVCGLVLSPGAPSVNPLIPVDWNWAGIRNLPYHGSLMTYFVVREAASGFRVYSTMQVQSQWDVRVYERDESEHIRVYSDTIVTISLVREDGAVALFGNTSAQTIHTPVLMTDVRRPHRRFSARTYNSERSGWEDNGTLTIEQLRGNAFTIEAGGFRLIELTAVED